MQKNTEILSDLRQQIVRIERGGYKRAAKAVLPFGIPEMDGHFADAANNGCNSGLTFGTLHEVSSGQHLAHDGAMLLLSAVF